MHIPDGVLSPEVSIVAGVAAAAAVAVSLKKLDGGLADRMVPLTGMTAAVVFAGQMVNFPIGLFGVPSVSGHLMGGVLAAALVGPWAGCVAIALVLAVQCVLFADGGILALGVNVFNMGVVGSLGGYAVYSVVRRLLGNGAGGVIAGVAVASWLSVMAAAAMFCLEFGLSHFRSADVNLSSIFTLMVTFHSAIGVGEALITAGAVGFVLNRRPDLLYADEATTRTRRAAGAAGRFVVAGMMLALATAAFLAPFASPHADGLEAVGAREFTTMLERDATVIVLGDYEVPLPVDGWERSPAWQRVSISLAGIIGTLATALVALVLGKTLRPAPATVGTSDVP